MIDIDWSGNAEKKRTESDGVMRMKNAERICAAVTAKY